MVDAWTRPDGTAARGPTAAIGVYDEKKSERSKQTAGEGAILDIHGRRWRLDAVRMPKAGNGSVQLVEIGP
jgi:hypothetical protein